MSENETPENSQPVDSTTTPSSDAAPPRPDTGPVSDLDEQVVPPEPLQPPDGVGRVDAAPPAPFTSAEHGGHLLPSSPTAALPAPGHMVPGHAASVAPGHPSTGAPTFADGMGDGAQVDASASPKKFPTGAVIGLVAAGAVVVLALGAAIAVPVLTRDGGSTAGGAGPTGDLSEPSQLVADYLTALADGDAAAARSFLELSIYDADLLTDEVLAMSLEAAPIADIEVGEPTEGEYDTLRVPVTFTIGSEKASRTFEVSASPVDDELSIVDGVERIPNYGFEAIPLSVNGVEIGDRAVVFPGIYDFSVDSEYFTIDGGDAVVVGARGDSSSLLFDLQPTLSDEGLDLYRELVDASLKECLAMKTIATPCGMDVSEGTRDGFTVIDESVTRALTAEGRSELSILEPRVSETWW